MNTIILSLLPNRENLVRSTAYKKNADNDKNKNPSFFFLIFFFN